VRVVFTSGVYLCDIEKKIKIPLGGKIMKKWLLKSMSVAALVGVVATLAVGTALAQDQVPQTDQGQGRHRRGRALIQQMSEATGLPTEAILGQLQGGLTPAEILSQQGVDPDTFIDSMLVDLQDHLSQAVSEGRIEQDRADQIYEKASEQLPLVMDRTFENAGPGQGQGNGQRPQNQRNNVTRGIIGRLLEETGLTGEELRAELEAGKTPGEILIENGGDPDAFTASVLADLQTKLDEAVAAGKIDQERADQIYAQASERLPEALDQTFDLQQGGGPGGGNRQSGNRPQGQGQGDAFGQRPGGAQGQGPGGDGGPPGQGI
jgi:hypothetical protein